MKEFKGIWLPKEVIKKTNINDKEKMIYSMILSLSKKQECIVTNLAKLLEGNFVLNLVRQGG